MYKKSQTWIDERHQCFPDGLINVNDIKNQLPISCEPCRVNALSSYSPRWELNASTCPCC